MRVRFLIVAGALVAALLPPASPAEPSAQAPCSWPTTLDSFNVAYPDTSADYWMTHFGAVPGSKLVIRGRYPQSRYFSFHAYDEAQRPVASLSDHQIRPDHGSNPFRRGGQGGAYTVEVVFRPQPARPKPNTVYAGTMENDAPNPAGWVIYRIYIPDDAKARTGGVALPSITLIGAEGAVKLPLERCATEPPPLGQRIDDEVTAADYPLGRGDRHVVGTYDPPKWKRFYGTDREFRDWCGDLGRSCGHGPKTTSGFLANHHIAYLYARISREFGETVVVRLRPPGFPDTREGVAPTATRDVRYWSLCQNNDATQRVVACRADFQTVLGRDGYATFVISDPGDRPSNATRTRRINWIPWGGAYYSGVLIYRHMLPSRTFEQAIQNIREGTAPGRVMRSYMPRVVYCDRTTIEASGIPGCFSRGAR